MHSTSCAATACVLAAVSLLGLARAAHAQGATDGPPPGWVGPPPGWSGGVLAGVASTPDYEGSRHQRVQPVLGAEISYRGSGMGSVAMGSRGLVWTPWQSTAGSASLGLSIDPGRVDHGERKLTPMGWRPGSAELRGLGEVKMTPLLAAAGSVALGPVSLSAALRQATASHRGSLVELGLQWPWRLGRHASLTIAPGLTWADRRHMQAYFGVTPAQSAASGFALHEAGAGLKSRQLLLDFDMAFSRHWHLNAVLLARRLGGDAATSPITQRREQLSGMLAARYDFFL